MTKRFIRTNFQIRAPKVRLIAEDNRQLGVVDTKEALRMAEEAELDLVEVAPGVNPPVCRIMDFSKFKYEQEKKERIAKKKQHVVHLKELKVSSKIQEHDYQVKLNSLTRFLKKGDKVKITMRFRGREMQHVDIGRNVLDRIKNDVINIGEEEKPAKLEGNIMTMVFAPKRQAPTTKLTS